MQLDGAIPRDRGAQPEAAPRRQGQAAVEYVPPAIGRDCCAMGPLSTAVQSLLMAASIASRSCTEYLRPRFGVPVVVKLFARSFPVFRPLSFCSAPELRFFAFPLGIAISPIRPVFIFLASSSSFALSPDVLPMRRQ